MIDSQKPLQDSLTPADHDAYSDGPKPDEKKRNESGVEEVLEPKDEPNAGESPLG